MAERRSMRQVARMLAESHHKEDPGTVSVYLAKSSREIRLIEISESAFSVADPMHPYRFPARPDIDIPYTSAVILLSVEDFQRVVDGDLLLPEGWKRLSVLRYRGMRTARR